MGGSEKGKQTKGLWRGVAGTLALSPDGQTLLVIPPGGSRALLFTAGDGFREPLEVAQSGNAGTPGQQPVGTAKSGNAGSPGQQRDADPWILAAWDPSGQTLALASSGGRACILNRQATTP